MAGIPDAAIQKGLDSFAGLPHRLEFVRELNGVEWINDSKATNVDSSLVALKALHGPRVADRRRQGQGRAVCSRWSTPRKASCSAC